MIQPLRARYGAKDNSHGLLEWQGKPAPLPSELLGLTDKPPGYHMPGEAWWPSLGCGAVGNWWALWWTVPDDTVSRAGMVRSEVAVWRLDEIGAVEDLRPVLASLAGLESIPASSPELLRAVAEALISSEPRRPPVVSDLDAWPSIIADLWTQLWPDARRSFSARVAVIPPQGGESVLPPLLYCVQRQRLSGWSEFPEIRVNSDIKPSRAALWLIGEGDVTFTEVLESCNSFPSDLKKLGTVARAAERLDKLRERSEPRNALELLRTLAVLAPNPDTARNLKIEALRELKRGFSEPESELVFLLKNLDLASLPIEEFPEAALTTWVSCQAPHLTLDAAQQLLAGLGEKQAQRWWQESVRQALSGRLANLDKQWAKSALSWLCLPDCAEILKAILPSTETVENSLLNVAAETGLAQSVLPQLQAQTVARQWPRLHAWAVMGQFSSSQAFYLQRKFAGHALAGLKYLVEHVSGCDVLHEVINTPDSQLIQLVAQRTVREPQLLQAIDVGDAAWRELWAAHIVAGGDCWPPKSNREKLCSSLLDVVVAGEKMPSGLIAPLAKDLAEIAFNHPDRAKLWSLLNPDSCAVLLPLVADVLIRACNTGQLVFSPESQLAQEVLKRSRVTGLSLMIFVVLLSSSVALEEQDLIHCVSSSTRKDWQPGVVAAVGKVVLDRRWKGAAEKIYAMSESIAEILPAVNAYQDLLSVWQRFKLSLRTGNNNHAPNRVESLVHRVAELGGNLAPEELDGIWERAGGKRKDLNTGGTPASRWQAAANMAQQGKLKGGLLAIVNELDKSFPHNRDLNELARLISHE